MRPHPIVTCSKPLASNASAAPLDVGKIKSALGALGLYEAPAWGVSQFPDAALFDAIRAFQKAQGLKVDGAIKPGGETEAALSQAMNPRRSKAALQATAQALQSLGRGGDELLAHITPEEAALLHTVTDGASVNPHTGLLEFFYGGRGGQPEGTGSVRDAVDRGTREGSGDRSFDPSADHKANQNGSNAQTDPDNHGRGQGSDATGGATGGGANAQGADGVANGGKGGPTRKEDTTKSQLGRSARVAGRQAGGNSLTDSFLETNAPEDEDAQDWNSGLLGEETSAPKATPAVDPDAVKNDKPAPAPKTKDDGQNKKGFNFFGNLAEDVRSIFNGTAQGPHSQYDKRNAEAPAEKYGLKGKDRTKPFLRGGYYGPGRGGYSPTGNYDAHFGNPVDGSGFTTRKSAENFPGLLSPGQQDYVAPNALDDLNATFMADAQKTQKEHRQRMADVAKAHQRTARAAERMKELAQTKSAPQSAPRSGYFSKNGVTFTDNWANDLIGGRASATTTPKDGLLGRTADQKASDVGEQSMVSKASASLKGTTPVSERQNTGMELMGSVGQYGLNDPEDVAVLQGALVASGHMNVLNATGWINTPTVVGIKALQKDLGLPTTGTVDPSDRSEEAMAAADQTTYVDAASAPYGRMAQAIRQKYQNELHTHKVSVSANPRNLIDETYHDLTSWHFEDRARLNSPLPSTEDEAIKMGFEKYPDEQSVFHQNNVGQPEKKYGHPDGREVVFDGDTGKVVTDSRYAGTYNYEVPAQMPENIEDFERWLEYLNKGSGHLIKDVAPYAIGGNVRGRN